MPLLFGVGTAAICYRFAGSSLGLFFGPVLILSFAAPALVLAEDAIGSRLIAGAALAVGAWIVWIVMGRVRFVDAYRCAAVLLAYVLALGGVATLLEHVRLSKVFASAITMLLGAAWLTWPVWLSPWFTTPGIDQCVPWLVVTHPLLTINGVLFPLFSFWDRYTLAYQQLTTLNQDVLYSLPRTIAWSLAVHAGVCIACLGWVGWRRAQRR